MIPRIAVVGAGLIGKRHAEAILAAKNASLACVVDPSQAGHDFSNSHGFLHFPTLSEMLQANVADGAIIATPNQLHVENGLECVAASMPALIEKPLAMDVEGGEKLVSAANAANVPLLTGHHRRHNPLIRKAYDTVVSGLLGRIATVQASTWFMKPDDYFDVDWRRRKGAGPVYINLIHDIDLLRHFCGEIESVHAMQSNAIRGNDVEDTCVIVLKFASGALGTLNVSDTVVAPLSWELTARENPAYPATTEDCYWIGGTKGSLALPNLALWQNSSKRSWWEPISATKMIFGFDDPLVLQIEQFAAVIKGEEEPLVSGLEGLKNLKVIAAIKKSAETGRTQAP